MSSPSSPTLVVDLRSRIAPACVAWWVIGVGAAAPLMIGALSIGSALAVGALAAIVLAMGFHQAGWLGAAHRVHFATWSADGHWTLGDRRGSHDAVLERHTRVWSHLVWLRLRETESQRVRSLVLTALEGPDHDLRRLVVRLRADGPKAASAPDLVAL